MTKLLMWGAGRGHLQAIARWARRPPPALQVTWVVPQAVAWHDGLLAGWIAGRVAAPACRIELAPLAQAAGVELLIAQAQQLDAAERQVGLADGRCLTADLVSLDTGAGAVGDALPGADEHAWCHQPAEPFVQQWTRLQEQARTQPVALGIVGGGPAGVELALAAAQGLGPLARVTLVTGAAGLLPGLPAGARRQAARCLRQRRVSVLALQAEAVLAGQVQLSQGARLCCDVTLLALAPGPPGWLRHSGLALDEAGFVRTDASLRSVSHPSVFAVGALTGPQRPAGDRGLLLARNLERQARGAGWLRKQWRWQGPQQLACGDGRAIGHWGPLSWHGRWAGWWKDRGDQAFVARHAAR